MEQDRKAIFKKFGASREQSEALLDYSNSSFNPSSRQADVDNILHAQFDSDDANMKLELCCPEDPAGRWSSELTDASGWTGRRRPGPTPAAAAR